MSPQDWPITATFVVSILPRYLLPMREFSAMAQSMESISISGSVEPKPPGRSLAMTRNPCEAHSVRMFSNQARGQRGEQDEHVGNRAAQSHGSLHCR